MADRAVRIVNDDDKELPVVDGVRVLNKTVETVNTDPFSRSAEITKSLDGQTPGFKRHVTAEIKKFARGADGTASKRIDEQQEFLSGYDVYEVVEPQNNFET